MAAASVDKGADAEARGGSGLLAVVAVLMAMARVGAGRIPTVRRVAVLMAMARVGAGRIPTVRRVAVLMAMARV
eukprot:CAMPEP_0195598426 /NCGR_PEP_ID=MMETSP0815-20121206/3506_1 /TAXON_ID=97485 /ORGANISM="Prymnesium parvum, Strain Texoma1" /LENGTH=73 /DNA_ID=CAMNT_0040737821 /DNA_START=714 /DNA_END=933 /DNA_ORIENTATION=-